MKMTKRLIAIIALLLSLVMMFTSCAELDAILGQLPGFGDVITPDDGTGDQGGTQGGTDSTGIIENPTTGTAYKFAMVHGKLGNKVYYLASGMAQTYYFATTEKVSEAIDVYLETAEGGYHLYTTTASGKSYINIVKATGTDGKEHINAVYSDSASSVFTFDATLKTLVTAIGDATYALGTRSDKEYTTISPCDVSKGSFLCQLYGQGGAGNTGDSGNGGTGTNQAGNFDLSLIPEPDLTSSSFDGYFVVNNNTPFFTDEEKATTTCFETYSALDSLGRVGVAFACVCGNTMPTSDRTGQSYKPTGWHQSTSYSGLDHLYDRSHLIAHSLAGENDNEKNLATGTVYMNQHSMKRFEDLVLDYLKENKSQNRVLYRVTPVFNGSNLLCSGVLMEAYSLDDGGEDIEFCVFVYNVQKGVHLDYATGHNTLASSDTDYGTGSGFKGASSGNTGSGDSGNTGGDNQGGTGMPDIVDSDIPKNSITNGKVTINVNTLGIPSQKYDTGKAMFGQTELAFVQIGNYGDGVQMRDKDGNTSIIWNNTALPSAIARIELVYSSTKSVGYDNADAIVFSFGTSASSLTSTKKLSTVKGTTTYTITPDGEFTYFKMEHDLGFSFYWESITIVLVDGTTVNPDNNTGSGNQGGTTGGEQGGTTGGNQGNTGDQGGTGSGSTDEQTYSYVLNKNSKKIHKADTSCSMSDKNRVEWSGSYDELQELLSSGYTTCGTCKPSVDK